MQKNYLRYFYLMFINSSFNYHGNVKLQKPKVHLNSKNSIQQAIKKKLFSQNKIQVKKRRPIDPLKKTVKELLREKRQDLNLSVGSELGDDKTSDGS